MILFGKASRIITWGKKPKDYETFQSFVVSDSKHVLWSSSVIKMLHLLTDELFRFDVVFTAFSFIIDWSNELCILEEDICRLWSSHAATDQKLFNAFWQIGTLVDCFVIMEVFD